MATIVFDEEIDPIAGSVSGVTFSTSQAGASVRRRPSPIQHHTTPRLNNWNLLSRCGKFFWGLTEPQKKAWAIWAEDNGIPKPFTIGMYQWGNAGFLSLQVPAQMAGDAFYIVPPNDLPYVGVTFTNLVRIDQDTIRATFNPSPGGADRRIFLRQTLPSPGAPNRAINDGYIAQISELNPASPYDFTTYFKHPAGGNCRYWTGSQQDTGLRSTEDLWDL